MDYHKAAILGATGPAGLHLANELRKRGIAIRAVSRNAEKLERMFRGPAVERCTADLLKTEQAKRAVEGCDLAFHCIGLPSNEMHLHRAAAAAVAEAVRTSGARCVHVSSYWSFLPLVGNPMNEDHPRQGGTPWMQARRAAEDVLREAGAAIANLPDFYGPGVHSSSLQQALLDAAHGRTINWIGAADTERAYCYLPDAAGTLVRLAEKQEAYGEHWLIPTAGPLSGRRVAEIASRVQNSRIKLRTGGLMLLKLFSLVNPPLRPFMQIVPEYVRPISYETVKIEHLLGPQHVTAYEEGIKRTIDWLHGEASGI